MAEEVKGLAVVLGIWVQASDGAKFWAGVCAERNRSIRDVLIVCHLAVRPILC